MRVKSTTDRVYYLLTDHLGSTSVTTDDNGGMHAELRYTAFGETRYTDATTLTGRRYTGQLQVEEGLYYYGARFYDSYLNRWIQPDSIIPDHYNVLDWDRYQYVRSNPINYNDPTGHDIDCAIGESECKHRVKVEKAEDLLRRLAQNQESVIWSSLSKGEQKILSDVGWDTSSFNNSDYVIPGIKDIAGTSQDPLVWLVTLVGVGRLTPSAISFTQYLLESRGIVNLYRAVGAGELADIINNGVLRTDPNGMSMGGKWFTNSVYLAEQWGTRFANWTGEAFTVVQVGVPRSLLNQMMDVANLDGIGPAWYADGPVLDALNQVLKYINVIH